MAASRITKTEAELVQMVLDRLNANGAKYDLIDHAPEGSCEKVSALRGHHPHAAAKALLVQLKLTKSQSKYVLVNLPGDMHFDMDAAKKLFNVRNAGMASKEKVAELLFCELGRVPPFSFHDSVTVLVDEKLVNDNDFVYFSPGRLDQSVKLDAKKFQEIILAHGGQVARVSKAPQPAVGVKPVDQQPSATPTASASVDAESAADSIVEASSAPRSGMSS